VREQEALRTHHHGQHRPLGDPVGAEHAVEDLLRRLGDLAFDEVEERSAADPRPWLLELKAEGRAAEVAVRGARYDETRYIPLFDSLKKLMEYRLIIYGMSLVLIMIFYPAGLNDLVPGYIAAIPMSPTDGKEYVFENDGKTIRVYTTGGDGKQFPITTNIAIR
jgi:hypothetical protein